MAIARGATILQLASQTGMDDNTVSILANASEEDFKNAIDSQQTQFLQILSNNELYSAAIQIDQDGQVLASVPPNQDYKLAVVLNSQQIEPFDFSSGPDVI